MPNQEHLFEHIIQNAPFAKRMVGPEKICAGQRMILCGAGPSLNDHLNEIRALMTTGKEKHRFTQLWACNSALPYLIDKGLPVTHGVAIDQGEEMLLPAEWERVFDVKYYVASSVHPKLVQHLVNQNRRVRFFHNYLGIEAPKDWQKPEKWNPPPGGDSYEFFLYCTKYPPTVQTGYGLNVVPRAMCLALWLGFKEIRVYGADCAAKADSKPMALKSDVSAYRAWLEQLQLYADGRTAILNGEDAIMVEGIVDDRRWHTRADMVVSARHLVDMARRFPAITLVGDTLPNAIIDKDDEFFKQMPNLSGAGSVTGFAVQQPPPPPPAPDDEDDEDEGAAGAVAA